MSVTSTPDSPFDVLLDVLEHPYGDELLSAAAALVTRAVDDPSCGVLVIVVRPGDDFEVVSGGGTGVLRAAVSVAVAAGNDRLWRNAPIGDTVESSTRELPEVIAAAADAAGVRSVHTGCIRRGDVLDAIAIWFETWHGVESFDGRRLVLGALSAAAERAASRAPAETAASSAQPIAPVGRSFDPNDPDLDPLTGLSTPDRFDEILEEFEGDDATLVIIDFDQFALVGEEWGDEVSNQALRIMADRLADHCGPNGHLARLGHDQFAILFSASTRSSALGTTKELLHILAEPLGLPNGPERLSATIALAHQDGLVDLEDMLDSAHAAIRSGKRSGAGRLVLAA